MDIISIIWQSLSITLFVISMMLVIEYVNVLTSGIWSMNLQKSKWKQVLLGATLGLIPGCLGAYTVVSLYVHNILGTGALVAAMIATSGDEAFFMFSIMPETAIILMAALFVIGIATGLFVNSFQKKKKTDPHTIKHFHIHSNEPDSVYFNRKRLALQFVHITKTRLALLILIVVAMVLVGLNLENLLHGLAGHEHDTESTQHLHPTWVGVTFSIVLGLSFFVVATVSDHFLEEHLVNHIVKKHLLKIFLWTFSTLLVLQLLHRYINLDDLITQNLTFVLLIAVLVGIIPESGPHLVFVLLFASGDIPLSILLASSIVQDGHGSLPLLAESPKGFLKVKLINVAVGLLVGGTALFLGM